MPLAAGAAWALFALVLFAWWTSHSAWSDLQRFCACWGATLACESHPYPTIRSWPMVDMIAKVAFDTIAVLLFAWPGWRVLGRKAEPMIARSFST